MNKAAPRKTKIVATIGPASRDPKTLDLLLKAGMDCARLNFSHGTLEEHGEVIRTLRQLTEEQQRPLAIMQDVGGIKLRIGNLKESMRVERGREVYLAPEGSSRRPDVVPFPHPEILQRLKPGDLIYISDGTICLEVVDAGGPEIATRVRFGGTLSSFKGVNVPGVFVERSILTEQDKVALQFGVDHGVDWVGVPFVRTREDILYARSFLDSIGSRAMIMAKLENRDGIDNIDSILPEVSGVMVARGDLGIEIPMEKVPIVQKYIVGKAIEAGKLSVVATQMLRLMVTSPTPSRAEISDVTNAVLDGCDAILLSDETTVGQYPVETVKIADTTIRESEGIYPYYKDLVSHDRTQAIASAAVRLVRTLDSKPIVITSTGRAAIEISRFRPNSDVLVYSHDEAVLRSLCLGWGLSPIGTIPPKRDLATLVDLLIKTSLDKGLVRETDVVTIVYGFLPGVTGTTNTIQIIDIRDYLSRS